MKKLGIIFTLLIISQSAMANAFETSMHSNGKINVVIGVIGIIFIGIVIYLFRLDRKLTRIENEIKNK